jgi:hypothetical protein
LSVAASKKRDDETHDRAVREDALHEFARCLGAIATDVEDIRGFIVAIERPADGRASKTLPSLLSIVEKDHPADYERIRAALASIVVALPEIEEAAALLQEFSREYDDQRIAWEKSKASYVVGQPSPLDRWHRLVSRMHVGPADDAPSWFKGPSKVPGQSASYCFDEAIWVEVEGAAVALLEDDDRDDVPDGGDIDHLDVDEDEA